MARFLSIVDGVKRLIQTISLSLGEVDADKIVSTFGNGKIHNSLINWDSPGAIGSTTPAAINATTIRTTDDVTLLGDDLLTPYNWAIKQNEPSFEANAVRTRLVNSWTASLGDFLYVGATGNASNASKPATIWSSNLGVIFGLGSNLGDSLTSTWATITSTGINATPIGATTPSTVAATSVSTSGSINVGNSGSIGAIVLINGAASNSKDVTFQSAGLSRWNLRNNTLDDFQIIARNDDGSLRDVVLAISRALGGTATISRPTAITNSTASTSTTTGALVLSGGLGLSGAINAGGSITTNGNLNFPNGTAIGGTFNGGAYILNAAASSRDFVYQTSGVARWAMRCNSGDDWQLIARNDDGSLRDSPFFVPRATTGTMVLGRSVQHTGSNLGFYSATPISKPTVSGARGGNAALASLLAQLASLGLITNSSTDSAYYTYLASFNPEILAPLEDGNVLARDRSGDVYGQYNGTYTQQQGALLSDSTTRSVLFSSGAIAINYSFPSPQAFTLVCRFIASPTASGAFFGYSNDSGFGGTSNDRQVYFVGDQIRLRVWTGSEFTLTTPAGYRDNAAHTLVVRVGGGLDTIISVDGSIVASAAPITPASYGGFWKIGHSVFSSLYANGIRLAGVAIYHKALSDSQIAQIHPNV